HPAQFSVLFPDPTPIEVRPAKFTHNFQFTAGVAFRLGDFPSADNSIKTSDGGRERTHRFEVGAQYTSITVNRPALLCAACLSGGGNHTEPGVGGRFTYNLTKNFALEAEGNFFTRDLLELPNPSGHMFQAQIGAKVGKRFDKWGLFGKVRPGF